MKPTICSRLTTEAQGAALYRLSWLAYAAAYVGRYNYSAVMGAITAGGTLSLSAAGAVSTGYFICYAAGQILFGLLSQSLSPYGMIFVGLCGSGLCNLGMGATPAALLGLLWAVNGLFQAMIWPPIVRLFAESMPLERQKSACVSINSTTPAGTLAAYALSAVLLQWAGWNHVFFACGGLLLGMALVFWLGTAALRRATHYQPQEKQQQSGQGNIVFTLLAAGLGALLVPVILHGGLKDGVTSWVPSMIQSTFGASPAFSAAISMALPLVNLTGAYLSGWLNEHLLHNELKTAGALFALASACLLALPLAVRTSLVLAVLLLAVTTASMLGANTMFINVIPVKAGRNGGAAVLSGTLNAITYLGAAGATWGIGAAAECFGWNAVFLLWLGMAVLALLVSVLLAGRWADFVNTNEGGNS